jgi:hypothetical protein
MYVTYPLINEKRLLIKIFDEIYISIINTIHAIINYEHLLERIKVYENKNQNIENFLSKIAKNYNLSEQHIRKIQDIIEMHKKHKQSAMEFVKKDKIVILSDNLGAKVLDVYRVKEYLLVGKELLSKVNSKINL